MNKCKIVVFVPVESADQVRDVIGSAGAGMIGDYSHCTFSSKGVGRFLGNENSNPVIGKAGQIEEVEEERIETICEKSKVKDVVAAIKTVHPYEEVALDVYLLEDF